MKPKITRGSSIRRAAAYVLDEFPNPKRCKFPEMIGGTLAGQNSSELTREFENVCALRPDIKSPVWHASLSLVAGERFDSKTWNTVVEIFLDKLGFDQLTPYIAVRHNDTKYDHIHILLCRISLNADVWHGQWEARRAIEVTQILEKKFGLTITPGLESVDAKTNTHSSKRPTWKEIQKADRTAQPIPRMVIINVIEQVMPSAPMSLDEFVSRLRTASIQTYVKFDTDGIVNGVVFNCDDMHFSGRQVGYSWQKLQQLGIFYEQNRECDDIIEKEERHIIERDDGFIRDFEFESSNRVDGEMHSSGERGPDYYHRLDKDFEQSTQTTNSRLDRANEVGSSVFESVEGAVESKFFADRIVFKPDSMARWSDAVSNGFRAWNDTAAIVADHAAALGYEDFSRQSDLESDSSELKPDAFHKVQQWRNQHSALMAKNYRLTLIYRRSEQHKKQPNSLICPSRSFTALDIENLIPRLRGFNAGGYDICIVPNDNAYHYIIMDAVTQQSLKRLTELTLNPCLTQSHSDGQYQVVYKLKKTGQFNELAIIVNLCNQLTENYGKTQIIGVNHQLLVAGFRVQQQSTQRTTVEIIHAEHVISNLIKESSDNNLNFYKVDRLHVASAERLKMIVEQSDDAEGSVFAEYRRLYKTIIHESDSGDKTIDALDGKALDYQISRELCAQCFSFDEIRHAVTDTSPYYILACNHECNENNYLDRIINLLEKEFASCEPVQLEIEKISQTNNILTHNLGF